MRKKSVRIWLSFVTVFEENFGKKESKKERIKKRVEKWGITFWKLGRLSCLWYYLLITLDEELSALDGIKVTNYRNKLEHLNSLTIVHTLHSPFIKINKHYDLCLISSLS